MKITNLNEDELNYIYSNYNFDNMIVQFDGYIAPHWKVPRLLVKSTNLYSDESWCSVDEDGWIYTRSGYSEKFLKLFTGLTQQELFDLCILHINDTDDRPKCAKCNSELKFRSMSWGYGSGPINYTGTYQRVYCDKCTNSIENYGWRSVRSRAKANRSNFIKLGNTYDECYFYMASTKDHKFKYGITSEIEIREHYYRDTYVNYRILYKSDRVSIANLEYQLKLDMGVSDEYLDFKSLSNFRKSFISAMNKLKSKSIDIWPISTTTNLNDYLEREYTQVSGNI